MKKIAVLLLLLTQGGFAAEEEVLLTRQAEAYYEAKEYDKAAKLLEKLSAEKLVKWQQERLNYNIGTIYLEQEKWQKAAEQYARISHAGGHSHLLMRALKTNQAVLCFREGSLLLEQKELLLEDLRKAIFLFRDALRFVSEAESAACELERAVGNHLCPFPEDLGLLRSAGKRGLAIALDKYGEAIIAGSSIRDGVPFLLAGVKLAITHLNFLETKKFDDNLKEKYLKLFTRDAESWGLLWDAQLAQLDSLDKAYRYYLEGIDKMKSQKLEESRISFLSSEASLSDLIRTLWGSDPLLKLLQDLLTAYRRALIQVPIQISALYQIETEQAQVEEIAEGKEASLEEFAGSMAYLKKSIDYAKLGRSVYVRFFLNEAKEKIILLLRKKLSEEITPEKILTDAIEDETHAVLLSRLGQEMEEEMSIAGPSLKNSQAQALKTVEPFYAKVLEQEVKEFPKGCQCKPWNQVIPLYEKGRQAANEAMGLIERGGSLQLAAALQEKAEKYWREALEKLKHPEEEKKPKPPKEKPEEEPPPPEEKQKEESAQEVLRRLQQMSQDDRRPEPKPTKPPEQGARPW